MKTKPDTKPEQANKSRCEMLTADVFRRGVLLCVGSLDDMWAAVARYNADVPATETVAQIEGDRDSCGFCIPTSGGESILFFRCEPELPVLVHEICHAAKIMLDDIGIDDGEAFAYLAEHLFAQAISDADASRFPSSTDAASPRTSSRTSRHGNRGRQSRTSSAQ